MKSLVILSEAAAAPASGESYLLCATGAAAVTLLEAGGLSWLDSSSGEWKEFLNVD